MSIVINEKRQLNKKDMYCIYRRKKDGKIVCSLPHKSSCQMYTNKQHPVCNVKVKRYKNELNIQNSKKDYVFGVEVEHVNKIDKKLKPAQYSLGAFTDKTTKRSRAYPMPRSQNISYVNYGQEWNTKNWTHIKYKQIVYVFDGFLYCATHKHFLSHGQVIVNDLRNPIRKHLVTLIYCNDCDKYYIDASQYKKFINQKILLNFIIKVSHTQGEGFDSFKPESELHFYGYNAKSSTSRSERQQILYDVVSNRLMRVEDIVSHLQGLININEGRTDRIAANERYREDIEFLYKRFPGASMEYRLFYEDLNF